MKEEQKQKGWDKMELLTSILMAIEEEPTLDKFSDYISVIEGGEFYEENRRIRSLLSKAIIEDRDNTELYLDLMYRSYAHGAKESFDDFMVACEWNREPKARFWLPRRKVLEEKHHIATKIQEFLDSDKEYLGLSMPPGTGKSTLIKFLMAYIYGKYPNSSNMYVSYSDAIVKMMYDSVSSIITDSMEYNFGQLFDAPYPEMSAEYYTITARRRGDFPTLGLISLGGSVTGRTRANKVLITDDLVKNKEMARSPIRLETLYDDYKNTLTTRTIGDHVKQIQLGTIWSVHDPISRMKAEHEGDPKYEFIAIPVKDEDGNSNFEYECVDRYTAERIRELENSLDPVDFSCLYMQQGMEKEGLAFPVESLNYYNGELPEGEPDNIIAWCDVAFGGGDSLALPIGYIFDGIVYIHDVVFSRGDAKVTKPLVASKLKSNNVRTAGFEANAGGDFYARDIDEMLKLNDYRLNIQTKRASTRQSKESRIEQYAPTIKEWFFRDSQHRDKEYGRFMEELHTFSFSQKNVHDDAADSLAGLAEKMMRGTVKLEVHKRWF